MRKVYFVFVASIFMLSACATSEKPVVENTDKSGQSDSLQVTKKDSIKKDVRGKQPVAPKSNTAAPKKKKEVM